MVGIGNTWVVVLAAGEGSRLRSLTTTAAGIQIPKQFCSLQGGPSLLHTALIRAGAVSARAFTCAIVAAQHRQWWEGPLQALPDRNVIAQPDNRGTANGILLPLLDIIRRDPAAKIVLLPSDHHVCDEGILARALGNAVSQISRHTTDLLMLGMEPDHADSELGYVVPGQRDAHGVFEVTRFVEKPAPEHARALILDGALWNAFIVAATAQALLGFFERRQPGIVALMSDLVHRDLSASEGSADRYRQLPILDFSRDVIEGQEARLRVLKVPRCGWSDLGTPKRVAEALRRGVRESRAIDSMPAEGAQLSLAAAHQRMR